MLVQFCINLPKVLVYLQINELDIRFIALYDLTKYYMYNQYYVEAINKQRSLLNNDEASIYLIYFVHFIKIDGVHTKI